MGDVTLEITKVFLIIEKTAMANGICDTSDH